ncbi:MAG: hypothetical protein D9V47_01385 [Clostridia bacterium]|nr:MAG: hypothetical protein D9V47_01385 [Clostridia bacterium]
MSIPPWPINWVSQCRQPSRFSFCGERYHRRTALSTATGRHDPRAGPSGALHRLSFEEMVLLDMCYINEWSVWLDLEIVFRTISLVLPGRGL